MSRDEKMNWFELFNNRSHSFLCVWKFKCYIFVRIESARWLWNHIKCQKRHFAVFQDGKDAWCRHGDGRCLVGRNHYASEIRDLESERWIIFHTFLTLISEKKLFSYLLNNKTRYDSRFPAHRCLQPVSILEKKKILEANPSSLTWSHNSVQSMLIPWAEPSKSCLEYQSDS